MLLGIALACSSLTNAQPVGDPSKLPLPDATLVSVNGANLAVRCDGAAHTGQPIVVLVAGQGVPAVSWVAPPPEEMQAAVMWRPPFGARQPVQPALAAITRTCVYDRPGLGSSGDLPDATPRTLTDAVNDLHTLLSTLSPDQPVVLVGHSVGGLIAFEYARAHGSRVAGLVLVDATHPDERQRLAWLFPPNAEREARLIAQHPEHLDVRAATSRGSDAVPTGTLGALPIAVLTRTNGMDAATARQFGVDGSPAMLARWRRDHWSLAVEYAAASSRGTLVSANDSGHFIGFDQPDLIVAAVQRLLEDRRTLP
ncbi:alpha/beta hydrolase [Deinococcus humi]|nr:alpha/beta hydrolase [Deinococcus humi]